MGFRALLGKLLSVRLSFEPQVPWEVVVTYHPMVAGPYQVYLGQQVQYMLTVGVGSTSPWIPPLPVFRLA